MIEDKKRQKRENTVAPAKSLNDAIDQKLRRSALFGQPQTEKIEPITPEQPRGVIKSAEPVAKDAAAAVAPTSSVKTPKLTAPDQAHRNLADLIAQGDVALLGKQSGDAETKTAKSVGAKPARRGDDARKNQPLNEGAALEAAQRVRDEMRSRGERPDVVTAQSFDDERFGHFVDPESAAGELLGFWERQIGGDWDLAGAVREAAEARDDADLIDSGLPQRLRPLWPQPGVGDALMDFIDPTHEITSITEAARRVEQMFDLDDLERDPTYHAFRRFTALRAAGRNMDALERLPVHERTALIAEYMIEAIGQRAATRGRERAGANALFGPVSVLATFSHDILFGREEQAVDAEGRAFTRRAPGYEVLARAARDAATGAYDVATNASLQAIVAYGEEVWSRGEVIAEAAEAVRKNYMPASAFYEIVDQVSEEQSNDFITIASVATAGYGVARGGAAIIRATLRPGRPRSHEDILDATRARRDAERTLYAGVDFTAMLRSKRIWKKYKPQTDHELLERGGGRLSADEIVGPDGIVYRRQLGAVFIRERPDGVDGDARLATLDEVDAAGVDLPAVKRNQLLGAEFERRFLGAVGLPKNRRAETVPVEGRDIQTVPDIWEQRGSGLGGRFEGAVVETTRSLRGQRKRDQIAAQIQIATDNGLPYYLVLHPSARITEAMRDVLRGLRHGGVFRFDLDMLEFTRVDL